MKTMTIQLRIHEYWHAGSGTGKGPGVDAQVVRDHLGLPYLPGRTLRGLLREGVQCAEDCKMISKNLTEKIFGTRSVGDEARGKRVSGALHVSSATVDSSIEAWIGGISDGERSSYTATLFETVSSTAMAYGVAMTGSLRSIEVAVPLTLTSTIGLEDDGAEAAITAGLGFIRGLGMGRRRGFGRVTVACGSNEKES